MSRVVMVKTGDRKSGVKSSIAGLESNPIRGKKVLIKPNFNTADPAPGSTHNDTLMAIVDDIWEMGARSISLGERSHPPTLEVMAQKGIIPLLEEKDVNIISFDDLKDSDWVEFNPKDSHWSTGFRIARPIIEAECLVSTGCLKTHQFGGVFTLSLKLHVGVVPTGRHGYSYMSELHSSPHQQKMIAEINEPFAPDLIVMDGVEAFVDGGPATGRRARGDVILAATDRIAVDAVGVAVLKSLGSKASIMNQTIFSQQQISRAVELGLGVTAASEIELVAANKASDDLCGKIQTILQEG